MKVIKIILCCLGLNLLSIPSAAEDELKVKIRSRALLDATISGYESGKSQIYYRLEDFRFGAKACYKNLDLKIDLAYGSNKVTLKDLLLSCHFPNSILAIGNTYEPFSLDMLISTADLRFHQSAASVLAFTNSRKLGITYHYYKPEWYAAAGIYTHNDINKIGTEQQLNSEIITVRGVRRLLKTGNSEMIHLGAAFSYRTKECNRENSSRTIKSNGVTSMLNVPMMKVEINNVTTEWKSAFEFLYTNSSFLFQSEYFLNHFNRSKNLKGISFHGGYVQSSYLLKGRKGFIYDSTQSIAGRPKCKQALELTARINYTNMTSNQSNTNGGMEWDLSLGINYYINQYFGIKWNCSYVYTGKLNNIKYNKDLLICQLRCQYIF